MKFQNQGEFLLMQTMLRFFGLYIVECFTGTGSEINFFRQAPTDDRKFFFSRQTEKCGRQKVSIKLFLCSETQTKMFGRHWLAGKIFAIDVIRNQTSAEIIF